MIQQIATIGGFIGFLICMATALVLALGWSHDRRLESNRAVRALDREN